MTLSRIAPTARRLPHPTGSRQNCRRSLQNAGISIFFVGPVGF
jgi:hypothetical protein